MNLGLKDSHTRIHECLREALTEAASIDVSWIPRRTRGWAMAPDALKFIAALIKVLTPRHVLEFGSGESTIIAARACAEWNPAGCVSSIEHDPDSFEHMSDRLGRERFQRRVALQLAPIVVRDFGGEFCPAYHLRRESFASQAAPDLILIDGPPAALGGRRGMLYQALDSARAGTLVLLDDASRFQEQDSLRAWEDNLGDSVEIEVHSCFAKGLASILVHAPVRSSALLSHKIDLSVQDIQTFVPDGDDFVLIDDQQWAIDNPVCGRRWYRLMEREGLCWGVPADDGQAMNELALAMRQGATHIVVANSARWWMTAYPKLKDFVHNQFRRVADNERLIIMSLRDAE